MVEAPSQPKSAVAVKPAPPKPRKLPPYNVVLLDDDHHTYDYVIRMLMKLFGHSWSGAWRMARMVDTTGRVIVATTTKEHAELKQEQIHAFGPDPDIAHCAGSMSAVIEPCPA
ncbi:MAG TPA: ATP-dependent Clp protease adaptor ClpS [Phycisphaerae bacterium]|nr:ATP-dependent Clp protease adaptor ClpS [Phycisphaerales bacterium]HRX83544.1 ATP-dependent Clp protease adaptor ClpS [Phycisphaerae bacterium]